MREHAHLIAPDADIRVQRTDGCVIKGFDEDEPDSWRPASVFVRIGHVVLHMDPTTAHRLEKALKAARPSELTEQMEETLRRIVEDKKGAYPECRCGLQIDWTGYRDGDGNLWCSECCYENTAEGQGQPARDGSLRLAPVTEEERTDLRPIDDAEVILAATARWKR